MENALSFTNMARIVILHQMLVQVCRIIVSRLAKLAARMSALPELGITLRPKGNGGEDQGDKSMRAASSVSNQTTVFPQPLDGMTSIPRLRRLE